jgi:uncharacterized OB-fold protein
MRGEQTLPSHILKSKIEIPYHWQAGEFVGRFLSELKNGILLASHCPTCGVKALPPRKICKECFTDRSSLVEVSNIGTLRSFTYFPSDNTRSWGMVRFDGCATDFVHFLNPNCVGKIKNGERMKASFFPKESRKGSILDIRYFDVVT